MSAPSSSIESGMRAYCAQIGSDPLLVQGAGGNASWKDGNTLWVKASGTWLVDAVEKDIFVPVDLKALNEAISKDDFLSSPLVMGGSTHKPSIETILHGLMPHKYVIHLHHVEALAHLVRMNACDKLIGLVNRFSSSIFIDYFKPGADLARAIFNELQLHPECNLIFLKNHGVVIGGESIEALDNLLRMLSQTLKNNVLSHDEDRVLDQPQYLVRNQYKRAIDPEIHQLATNPDLFSRLKDDWALYPDHVVFLGHSPFVFDHMPSESEVKDMQAYKPIFIFIKDVGVFESNDTTVAQRVQLRCYYDVMIRQSSTEKLSSLSEDDILSLLNWDAEKHRQAVSLFIKN
ncbi:class II aldolase/adducin family protein [Polynucleobacter asymbioticus]|uniref:class II aldolase/adducin family protein n=1 Tax=Polynucleobacter asymbioticus TaxID=576611 RepID=UPI0008F82E2B|nr:class II aldolase/adducin family protein [Polynucleobacter asymbioticus]